MITAGSGPVPTEAYALGEEVRATEEWLLDLPQRGQASLHAQVPNPSSFIALSERGLFVYDWTDIHRPLAAAIGAYELVASPAAPLELKALPTEMRRLALELDSAARIGAKTLKLSLG